MQKLNNVINLKKDEAVPVPRKVSSIKYGVSTSTIKLYEQKSDNVWYVMYGKKEWYVTALNIASEQ